MKSLSLSTSGRPPPADTLHDGTSMWWVACQLSAGGGCRMLLFKSFAHELFTFVVQQLKLLLAVTKIGTKSFLKKPFYVI